LKLISVTSFFGIKVRVFLENDKTDLRQFFFQGLRENTCLLQLALKSNALKRRSLKLQLKIFTDNEH